MSRQWKIRHMSRRCPQAPAAKTGSKKDQLPLGFKPHENALQGDTAKKAFIPKLSA
jgi:hypothetical protein